MSKANPTLEQQLQPLIDQHREFEGPLLPLLHAIQRQLGYIPDDAVPLLAEALHLSRAEIHGVISFYHQFRTSPGGRHRIQICRAEACQAVGARALVQHAKTALGLDFGETSAEPEHTITLEPVYCLGNCACGPSVRIDDRIHGRIDSQRFDQLVSDLKASDREGAQ